MSKRNLKEMLLELLQTNHQLSAQDFLKHLKKRGKTYNKTSVYRALEHLMNEKKVCRHNFQDDEAVYELQAHDHTHLICSNCHEVTVGDCWYVQPKEVNGFIVDHHHVTLVGLCKNCQTAS